jgi:phage shock protein C
MSTPEGERSFRLSRFKRYPGRGWVAGVCAGLAVYFDWNVKVLRLVFALGLVFSGFFPIGVIYCLLWYLMDPVHGESGERHARAEREPAAARAEYGRYASYGGGSGGDVRTRFTRLETRLRSMEECVSSRDFELRRELKKLEASA